MVESRAGKGSDLGDGCYCATCNDSPETTTYYRKGSGTASELGVGYIHWIGVQHVQITTRPYHSPNHFFFPFFFFTPPPVDAVGVLGGLEPCVTGEMAAACA